MRVVANGIEVGDEYGGTKLHEHDMLVLATSFRDNMCPEPSPSDVWKDGAAALYSTTVRSLPNLGMFDGPIQTSVTTPLSRNHGT
jgi:hypothetical protein